MNIDPTETPAVETMLVNEVQQFSVLCDADLWERGEEVQDLGSICQPPTSQFANDEWVA